MSRQFALDKGQQQVARGARFLPGGNRSMVVRETTQLYADREDLLAKIEADPGFQVIPDEFNTDADIEAGRITTHAGAVKLSRAKNARSEKR